MDLPFSFSPTWVPVDDGFRDDRMSQTRLHRAVSRAVHNALPGGTMHAPDRQTTKAADDNGYIPFFNTFFSGTALLVRLCD
jgi:hypothetical protein